MAEVAFAGKSASDDRQLAPRRERGRDHQRLAEVAMHLPPEDVEILGRRGAVGDLDIVLGAD